MRGWYRIAVQNPKGGRRAAGKQHSLSEKETEYKPGKEPYRQGKCNKEFQVYGLCLKQGERKGCLLEFIPKPCWSEEQAARNHEAKLRSKHPKGHKRGEVLNDGMAQLLHDRMHEAENEWMGRVDAIPNPWVHFEVIKETENQIEELNQAEYVKIFLTYGR